MGSKNNPGRFDCYDKAEPDEPMFVLLGRDDQAPDLVRRWAEIRSLAYGQDDPKVLEAFECAGEMEAWCRSNVALDFGAVETVVDLAEDPPDRLAPPSASIVGTVPGAGPAGETVVEYELGPDDAVQALIAQADGYARRVAIRLGVVRRQLRDGAIDLDRLNDEVARALELELEESHLALIEAQNPGIDLDDVRASRAAIRAAGGNVEALVFERKRPGPTVPGTDGHVSVPTPRSPKCARCGGVGQVGNPLLTRPPVPLLCLSCTKAERA